MFQAETKKCQNCKTLFVIDVPDFDFYEKMDVPPPSLCPDCRMKRKLVWRNERTLYKRNCDLCGKSVISMYHPRYLAPIYCLDCYLSEKWDPYSYAVVYDSHRSFFEQFGKLLVRVPKMMTYIGTAEGVPINSEYINLAGGMKNCYLVFNSSRNEDCGYSRGIIQCRNSFDVYFADQLELSYECVNVNKSYKIFWGQNINDSLDSYFVLNCSGVQNCFGCVNLRHKSYHFFNKPLSKKEWTRRVEKILGSYRKIEETQKEFEKFVLKFPYKENNNLKSTRCIGDYIFQSNNCIDCFEIFNCEDCKYNVWVKLLKDSYDIVGRGYNSELLLETVASGHNSSKLIGTWGTQNSYNIAYSFDLRSCENCFGCAGLKNAQYCILNKKYSKDEYNKLSNKIIEELKGKGLYCLYFPPELSPWAYNETLAQENYPLTKKQAILEGFRWEEEIFRTKDQETLPADKIPDRIKDVPDSILNETLKCIECGYNYKIIRAELEFYRQMNIPIPRRCFFCRNLGRAHRRGLFKIYSRQCDKCKKPIQTTHSPDKPEIVYCEKCYLAEVV